MNRAIPKASPAAVSCVIFDCDGVLVESEAVSLRAELGFLASQGVRMERDEYVRRFMGTSRVDWMAGMAVLLRERTGREPGDDELLQIVADIKRDLLTELATVAGATAAVAAVRQPKCVASSSPVDELEAKLAVTGLDRFFGGHVFSAQQVEQGKPAPDLFLHAAATMGVSPAECVVLEDSSNGILAARRAGMTAIGLVAGSHCPPGHDAVLAAEGADFVARSFDEAFAWFSGNGQETAS